jgi:hypothetical protein
MFSARAVAIASVYVAAAGYFAFFGCDLEYLDEPTPYRPPVDVPLAGMEGVLAVVDSQTGGQLFVMLTVPIGVTVREVPGLSASVGDEALDVYETDAFPHAVVPARLVEEGAVTVVLSDETTTWTVGMSGVPLGASIDLADDLGARAGEELAMRVEPPWTSPRRVHWRVYTGATGFAPEEGAEDVIDHGFSIPVPATLEPGVYQADARVWFDVTFQRCDGPPLCDDDASVSRDFFSFRVVE